MRKYSTEARTYIKPLYWQNWRCLCKGIYWQFCHLHSHPYGAPLFCARRIYWKIRLCFYAGDARCIAKWNRASMLGGRCSRHETKVELLTLMRAQCGLKVRQSASNSEETGKLVPYKGRYMDLYLSGSRISSYFYSDKCLRYGAIFELARVQ